MENGPEGPSTGARSAAYGASVVMRLGDSW